MLELIEHPASLELRPDPECLEELAECTDLWEALEHFLCNGWEIIAPEEVGALTDGLIISNDYSRDDLGNLDELGRVFWDADYAVTDTLAELQAGRSVRWVVG
jgi:hypothetical protein